MTSGGASDSEQRVPTVTPQAFPFRSAVVTTDTGVATWALASRNVVTPAMPSPFTARRPRP